MILSILALLGIAVLSYPQIAAWFSMVNQAAASDSYRQTVDLMKKKELDADIERAREYNASLSGVADGDAFARAIPGGSEEAYAKYLDQLNQGTKGVMGRIRIPEIKVKLPIRHGTSDEVLHEGVGHLYGSELPVGGEGTRSVLTGHSGLADAVLFTDLNKLKSGDRIFIDIYDQTFSYRVTSFDVVEPSDTSKIKPTPGKDMITLVTCTPIGINSHRLLVHAERELPTPAGAHSEAPTIPGFPWFTIYLPAALGLSVWYVWAGVRRVRKLREEHAESTDAESVPAQENLVGA
ncbi:class C sortase [Leucobacter sp. USHLN153]|uniref:class C sortase n=1 Tax=Leucobacter sp. USHLN153 TaxID=3081268 RepID=UPI003015A3FD